MTPYKTMHKTNMTSYEYVGSFMHVCDNCY